MDSVGLRVRQEMQAQSAAAASQPPQDGGATSSESSFCHVCMDTYSQSGRGPPPLSQSVIKALSRYLVSVLS